MHLPASFSSIMVINVVQTLNYLLECWSLEWVLTPTLLNQPATNRELSQHGNLLREYNILIIQLSYIFVNKQRTYSMIIHT